MTVILAVHTVMTARMAWGKIFRDGAVQFLIFLLFVINAPATANEPLLERAWQDLQYLSSDQMAGRYPESAGHQLAQQFIVDRFAQLKLQPLQQDYRHPFEFNSGIFSTRRGVNLVAKLTGCRFPQSYVVVTAHYDHLNSHGGRVFNGADDNASGVAGMLYLAAILSQRCPAYSYIFIATDAEEHGLDGAKAWLQSNVIPRASQLLNINLDMISRGEKRQRLYLAGKRSFPALAALTGRQSGKVKLVLGHDRRSRVGALAQPRDQVDWSNASDHAEFRRAGIPYMYFGVDVHSDYHTPTDDWQNIEPSFFYAALQLIAQSVVWVEQQEPSLFEQSRRAGS